MPVGVVLPVFATVPLNVTVVPTVPVIGDGEEISVIVVLVSPGVDHLFSKFATFTEPNPVARSYPVPATNAGLLLDATTPNPPLVV